MTIRISKKSVLDLICDRLDSGQRLSVMQGRWLVSELRRVMDELREARRTAGDGGGHE